MILQQRGTFRVRPHTHLRDSDSISESKIAVFVGPTLHGINLASLTFNRELFTFFPPIRRDDLRDLRPQFSTVVIVDGCFQQVPAVGHVELRECLKERTIYGCSSMGAIRAFELRELGMIGFGEVYEMFFKFDDFSDDEVALLHGPPPFYLPLSEPLVNIRFFLKMLCKDGTLCALEADNIISQLKQLYFGHRTLGLLKELLTAYVTEPIAQASLVKLGRNRIKSTDFVNLLHYLSDYGAPLESRFGS